MSMPTNGCLWACRDEPEHASSDTNLISDYDLPGVENYFLVGLKGDDSSPPSQQNGFSLYEFQRLHHALSLGFVLLEVRSL